MSVKELVKSITSRKDPQGYYIIMAKPGARRILEEIGVEELEEVGDIIVAKTKSRRKAAKIVEVLYRRSLLAV